MPPTPPPHPTAPCPKCGRKLRASGEVSVDGGKAFPTYTCEECLRVVDFAGERVELPLTFCVDEKGRAFDPAEPDADLSK